MISTCYVVAVKRYVEHGPCVIAKILARAKIPIKYITIQTNPKILK